MYSVYSVAAPLMVVVIIVAAIACLSERLRRRAKWAIAIALILFVVFVGQDQRVKDEMAVAAGFEDAEDRSAAEDAGITDPDAWAAARRERQAAELAEAVAEEQRALERKRQREANKKRWAEEEAASAAAEAAACREELTCWAEKGFIEATARCVPLIERLASNDFEWVDGWSEPKLSHYRWVDKDAGTVSYVGDRIKYQNGFGAWIYHVYECDFDPVAREILDIRATPGRLPP